VKAAEWKEFLREGEPDKLRRIGWLTRGELPNGLKYQYEMTIELTESKDVPSLRIRYQLKNIGRGRVSTDFYQHNFFNVDGDPIGPNYALEFPYKPKLEKLGGKFADLVTADGKELRFTDKLTEDFIMAGVTGYNISTIRDRQVTMKHAPSGVRVVCAWDYGTQKLNIWGVKTTLCPEPFGQLVVEPRQQNLWSVLYRFERDTKK
jgi:hypothetical protein